MTLPNDVSIAVLGGTGSLKFRHRAATNGAARAFDARTGAPKRTFDPIPRDPADPLHASWTPAALQETGGAEPWTTFAVDAARDLVFKGISQPSGYTEPLLHAYRLRLKAEDAKISEPA